MIIKSKVYSFYDSIYEEIVKNDKNMQCLSDMHDETLIVKAKFNRHQNKAISKVNRNKLKKIDNFVLE